MKKVTESSQNNVSDIIEDHLEENQISPIVREAIKPSKDPNLRLCPSCGMMTIKGMPGGRDATCTNCGYKDPCCYD